MYFMKTILIKTTNLALVLLFFLFLSNFSFSNNVLALPPCPAGEVEVIFTLDMTCADTDLRPPVVTGPFNGFSGDGNIMIDPDGDDIWEAIICAVPGSTFEYKYAILNFADQENLVDDAIGGAPCSYNTNFFDFSNRLVTIPAGGGALPIDTYGICGTCDNPPINVTFNINMNCSDVPPGTQVAMFGEFNGFCCPFNLQDPEGDDIWTTTLPFPPDEYGCVSMQYLYMSPNFSNVESFLTNGEDLSTCPNINSDFYNFANRIIIVCADTVLDDYWNTCFTPEEPVGGCDDNNCDNGVEAWDGCECITTASITGCTDNTACNFDPNANCDDNSCDFGNSACANPCNEIFGCTDAIACNYDPNACVDDGSCDLSNSACSNPCNEVLGCTDAIACNYNPAACVDDGSCEAPPCNPGCTDLCADNYDATADADDGSCNPYDMTCNVDCTTGPFGGIWDATTCSCINETIPINGCTDNTACNYDASANCDDATCDFGNADCSDPCNPIAGCMDATACNFNPNACVDDGSCQAPPCNPGCTDLCADNYDATADSDDGSCNPYDMTCNVDCILGDIEIWDTVSCSCVVDVLSILGCTDPMAINYDVNVNCDDGSCVYSNPGCTDLCADNYDPSADTDDGSCNPYDNTCNTDCNAGPFGGIWDLLTCACVNETTPVNGCTNSMASNYEPTANCDDGSCITTCEEEIAGSIIVPDEGCDVSGLEVMIMATDGTSITVVTDSNGNFTVPGGPFICGTYSATITDANVPACFTETGNIGPVQFEVDGAGDGDDGPFFYANPAIPTLSQWGLLILVLLLMTFGALKLGFQHLNHEVSLPKVKTN